MSDRPPHIVPWDALTHLRSVSAESPLRILSSACLKGLSCIYDGSSLGKDDFFQGLFALPTVQVIGFCPEDTMFGTPRALCDIHGGNGFDVLDGKARVLTHEGTDWTIPMLEAADKMLKAALNHQAELAILLDMSAACGVQVISKGARMVPDRAWQLGPGVCAAKLIRHNIPVISQRDDRSLHLLRSKLDPGFTPDPKVLDHHEREWYQAYFHPVSSPHTRHMTGTVD